mmetsp:Transcript_33500/g.99856  ORF Transcript_33500/g.99856 Transcript_33500/m.99856 type:complete len:312 (+) Transcript_33500:50-985(+)
MAALQVIRDFLCHLSPPLAHATCSSSHIPSGSAHHCGAFFLPASSTEPKRGPVQSSRYALLPQPYEEEGPVLPQLRGELPHYGDERTQSLVRLAIRGQKPRRPLQSSQSGVAAHEAVVSTSSSTSPSATATNDALEIPQQELHQFLYLPNDPPILVGERGAERVDEAGDGNVAPAKAGRKKDAGQFPRGVAAGRVHDVHDLLEHEFSKDAALVGEEEAQGRADGPLVVGGPLPLGIIRRLRVLAAVRRSLGCGDAELTVAHVGIPVGRIDLLTPREIPRGTDDLGPAHAVHLERRAVPLVRDGRELLQGLK